jgi:hypothetical protein
MAKFKSTFFSDESYNYKTNTLERIYKELKANQSYVIVKCTKDGEVNSPATIKLDTDIDNSGPKRNWEIDEKSDISAICEGYLDYKPDSITVYSFNIETPRVLTEKNYLTGDIATYNY